MTDITLQIEMGISDDESEGITDENDVSDYRPSSLCSSSSTSSSNDFVHEETRDTNKQNLHEVFNTMQKILKSQEDILKELRSINDKDRQYYFNCTKYLMVVVIVLLSIIYFYLSSNE